MKKIYLVQALILLGGTVFAWYTVYVDFQRFMDIEGTIFKVTDCRIPNPVTTPCFYGAWAFLIAFLWSIVIIRQLDAARRLTLQKRLVWFLTAGTLFAWGNFGYGLWSFIANQGKPTIGCSGLLVGNPYGTPCFYGAALFLTALVAGTYTYWHTRKQSRQTVS